MFSLNGLKKLVFEAIIVGLIILFFDVVYLIISRDILIFTLGVLFVIFIILPIMIYCYKWYLDLKKNYLNLEKHLGIVDRKELSNSILFLSPALIVKVDEKEYEIQPYITNKDVKNMVGKKVECIIYKDKLHIIKLLEETIN